MTAPIYLSTDFYKLSHREQYPKGTTTVYSTMTPRSNKFADWSDEIVFFGLQYFIKEYLINRFNKDFFEKDEEEVVSTYVNFVKQTLGKDDTGEHLRQLHRLGYLPIEIKALPEGSLVPMRVPVLTIENTHPDFYWLTNFIETILSTSLWQPMTSATLAYSYRKVLDEYAMKTVGSIDFVDYQSHDFSMRGLSSEQSAMTSGMGHLTSFKGSDTIPAIFGVSQYYNAPLDATTATSIPATEHSVMCAYGQTSEFELLKHLMFNVYPTGMFSVVCDTWDFWKVVSEYLPKLKDDILNRDGKVVIRPDSGDVVEIICGKQVNMLKSEEELTSYLNSLDDSNTLYYYNNTNQWFKNSISYEPTVEEKGLINSLWDLFGGEISSTGYRQLDSHIGAIYGDSITLDRAKQICQRLEEKGFASTNIVLGVGSFSYQYHTRDTFGWAVKATYAIVNDEERLLFKDPKTDDGTKRSQRGRVSVYKNKNGKFGFIDGLTLNTEKMYQSELTTVYKDGQLMIDLTLEDIRQKLK